MSGTKLDFPLGFVPDSLASNMANVRHATGESSPLPSSFLASNEALTSVYLFAEWEGTVTDTKNAECHQSIIVF